MSPLSVIGYIWDSSYERGMDQLIDGQFDVAVQTFSEAKGGAREMASAQYAKGLCLLYGIGGVKKDENMAQYLLKKASEADDAPSIQRLANYVLGVHYAERKKYIAYDKDAEYYLEKSALAGYALAQYKLGMYYMDLSGMNENMEAKAVKWLKNAQGNASQLSAEVQNEINDKLEVILQEKVVAD